MPAAARNYMSTPEFMALEDEFFERHHPELIAGRLVVNPTPANRHEGAVMWLTRYFLNLLVGRHDLTLRTGGAILVGRDTVFEPDLFIYHRDPENPFPRWEDVPMPLLVVEVLSPSTKRRDRTVKRHYYQRAGVAEYWIVDLDRRCIERWTPSAESAEIGQETLHFNVGETLEGTLELNALFDDSW